MVGSEGQPSHLPHKVRHWLCPWSGLDESLNLSYQVGDVLIDKARF